MRKLVMSIVTGVAVIGLSAAAFAVGTADSGTTDPVAGPSLVTTTTTTVASGTTTTTTTAAPAPSAPTTSVASDAGTARSTDGCDGGTYANHGAYVSQVAHDPDRQPGDVSAAAQSDCGKPLTATGATDDADSKDSSETTEATESEQPTPATATGGNGHGNSNGHGNGRG